MINIQLTIEYIRNGWDDHVLFSVSALKGLVHYKYEIPLMGIRKNGFKFFKAKKAKKEKKGNEENKKNKKESVETKKAASKDSKSGSKTTAIDEETIDLKKETSKKVSASDKFSELMDRYDYFKIKYDKLSYFIAVAIRSLRSKISLKDFRVNMTIGTEDAALTGILSGIAWMITGIIFAHLSNAFTINKNNINIKTNFSREIFEASILCIFNVKLVHIIKVGFILLYKIVGRRWLKWRNIQFRVL
ncbi:MAG: DUF2953 domain-containing protein [Bacillota bacterium]|nr:DUF2953 domain-containing protein [Bacillota bacterium]